MRKVRKTVESELNRLIDGVMHPYFRECPALIVLDGLLHAMVEQDLNVSLRKFVRYNLPGLLKNLEGKQK